MHCALCVHPLEPSLDLYCERCTDLNPKPPKDALLKALFYLPLGARAILKNKALFLLSLGPILLTLLTLSALIWIGFTQFEHYLSDLIARFSSGWGETILGIVALLLGSFSSIVLFVFLFVPIATLISTPFLDPISQAAESQVLGKNQPLPTQWGTLLKDMILLLAFKAGIVLISLPLLFIPVLGHLLFLYVLALLTALDFFDIMLSRKQFDFKEKRQYLKRNALRFFLFALPLLPMIWLPVLQLFLIPSATVGAVFFVLGAPAFKKDLA